MFINVKGIVLFLIFVSCRAGDVKKIDFKKHSCSYFINNFPSYTCARQKPQGKGSSGVVYLVEKEGTRFILKVQKIKRSKTQAFKDLIYLSKLKDSPYVINIVEHRHNEKYLLEILEFAEKGNLNAYIKSHSNDFGNNRKTFLFLLQIVDAVIDVHSYGIVHADLKTANVVVTKNNHLKIIDFDLSVKYNTENTARGTPKYMDPMMLAKFKSNSFYFNDKQDIYSIGVILFEMSQGLFPFDGESTVEIIKKQSKHFYTLKKGTNVELAKIINFCLKLNPRNRKPLKFIREILIKEIDNKSQINTGEEMRISNVAFVDFLEEEYETLFEYFVRKYSQIFAVIILIVFLVPASVVIASHRFDKIQSQITQNDNLDKQPPASQNETTNSCNRVDSLIEI
jgi:serine/threonine protein kinase